jgi:hypothetical protein
MARCAARAPPTRRSRALGWLVLAASVPIVAPAQELEPRAYVATPVGTTFLVVGDTYSSGSAVFDATSPFSNVHASFSEANLSVGQVFALSGRQSSLLVALPYARGDVTGDVGGNQARADRSGLADARLRFSMLLMGGPALKPAEFGAREQQTILGVSLTAVAPTGQYDSTKLINISANRWALKPEIALSVPEGRWLFDLYEGVWFFEDNDNFYGGHRRAEDPILSTQGHVSYTLQPRLWVAVDATYYTGGAVTVNGAPSSGALHNVRVGLTASVPVARTQSLKFSYSNGAVTRVGGNFRSIGVAWQYAFIH